jgi:hypothetical protein
MALDTACANCYNALNITKEVIDMVTDSSTQSAPYAPVDNVLKVVRRFRERGLPAQLSAQELERLGIPAGNAPRTLVSLKFLGLVEEDGQRTQVFDRLGKASTDEYPQMFAEILRSAYAPVFTIVDPSKDGDIAIHDAFRQYSPEAQRSRMVTLFLGLCREAGIVAGGPPTRRSKVRTAIPNKTRNVVRKREENKGTGGESDETPPPPFSTDYRVLSALIQQLPKDGKWTASKREKWLGLVTAAVDYQIDIMEDENE